VAYCPIIPVFQQVNAFRNACQGLFGNVDFQKEYWIIISIVLINCIDLKQPIVMFFHLLIGTNIPGL